MLGGKNPTLFEVKKVILLLVYFQTHQLCEMANSNYLVSPHTWICNYIPALYSRRALFQSAANVKLKPISASSLKVPATNESKYLSQPLHTLVGQYCIGCSTLGKGNSQPENKTKSMLNLPIFSSSRNNPMSKSPKFSASQYSNMSIYKTLILSRVGI